MEADAGCRHYVPVLVLGGSLPFSDGLREVAQMLGAEGGDLPQCPALYDCPDRVKVRDVGPGKFSYEESATEVMHPKTFLDQ